MRKLKGRRGVGIAAVVVAVLAALAGIAGAAGKNKPVKVIVGNIELTANGGFTPEALSKTKQTPIAFFAEGKIRTLDGTHPPALKEFIVETDKNGALNVKGFPTCTSGVLQSRTTHAAEEACPDAIIGSGFATAGIKFSEQPKDVLAKSKIVVFNGGESGGVVTLFIHAYITIPVPAAIVTTVKVKKVHNGRYGLLSTGTIPKIAGGAGSVIAFNLKIDKKYTYKGQRISVLTAKCPDGKLQARGTGVFADGTRLSAEVIRTCTGKG
ncbi:MAG TPA: hypothetical protein VFJ57_13305 [Solirubrobacterales bacterium]|nr:hypothetical protein [Solirubrobacterales bacterium]